MNASEPLYASAFLPPDGRLPGARLKYEAAESSTKRKTVPAVLETEDNELPPTKRTQLQAAAYDIRRNFSLAGWMIRRHLDYVATMSFRSMTGNLQLDAQVEAAMNWWAQPEHCDITGRHTLQRLVRLLEAGAVISGDSGLLLLADGRLQSIEGERVRHDCGDVPPEVTSHNPIHGVLVNEAGKALSYCVAKRSRGNFSSRFVFDRLVPAEWFVLHGTFDRTDQVRGVTPLSAALNELADTKESCELARARLKIDQLFGIAFYREQADPLGNTTQTDDTEGAEKYEVDFGAGPVKLELDPGDRAEFLESKNPSEQFLAFNDRMIQFAIKSLDIPFSFFNESFTNYSGSRQALLQYEQSAEAKRNNLRTALDRITAWRLAMFIEDGQIDAKLSDMAWHWDGAGLPWIDPVKEIEGDERSVALGVNSRQRVARSRGVDFFDVSIERAIENRFLAKLGLPTDFAEAQPVQKVEVQQ